ncbi:MAG: FtsX-like permease family protein [Bacteroidota bacterium]
MSLLQLSLAYLRRRPFGTVLNVVLLALGLATIVVLLLFSAQVERNLSANSEGIDVVIGAKGSPLQLILSSVYHVDSPTGNIPVTEAEALMQNTMVAAAIPLALGDSYRGYRIVGSTVDYLDLYDAKLDAGAPWSTTREVVLGAQVAAETGLALGDELVSAHGLSEGGATHDDVPLTVVGLLAPNGTVLDRLILTSVETVWAVHGDHSADDAHHDEDGEHHDGEHHGDAHHEEDGEHGGHGDDDHDHGAHDGTVPTATAASTPPSTSGAAAEPPAVPVVSTQAALPGGIAPPTGAPGEPSSAERQYTAVLLTYASPMAAVMFPRMVNAETNLLAAAPAVETQRLLSLLGVGLDALRLFGIVLIIAAALGLGIALYNAMRDRRYDLAVMRSLGARRRTLVGHALLEGTLLASMGTVLGLFLGHGAASALGAATAGTRTPVPLSGLTFVPEEFALIALMLGLGIVAALIPAIQAYRTDIARLLAQG